MNLSVFFSDPTTLKFVFRPDKRNVGDWWSPPFRYFPFKPAQVIDILNPSNIFAQTDTIIMGGGGLGRESFRPYLNKIKKSNVKKFVQIEIQTFQHKAQSYILTYFHKLTF